MNKYIIEIETIWTIRDKLTKKQLSHAKEIIADVINLLDKGHIRICEQQDGKWIVHYWIKKAILLYLRLFESQIYESGCLKWYDKLPQKFSDMDKEHFKEARYRVLPGAFVRKGSYIANNVVIMPSFINVGAYIDSGTMIDTWATLGSCAQIGKNCHISGGVGIGGVLEPIQNNPVIIEDNCFIGARSEIVEGVVIGEGSVISMGVFIGASTKIVYRRTNDIIYGKIPPYSVVVPGSLPDKDPNSAHLYCAVIVKQVNESTREKVAINELLRY